MTILVAPEDKRMRLISTIKLAEKLGVHRNTVWRLHRTVPDFPRAIKLGHRSVVFNLDEVEAWLFSRQHRSNHHE